MPLRSVKSLAAVLTAVLATATTTAKASAQPAPAVPMRDVLLVGNAVSGSVSFLDGHTFANLGALNIIPDLEQRLAEIDADPVRQIIYGIILHEQQLKHFEPDGGKRFVDDAFVSPDGNTLYVSRSNLGDVVAFDLGQADHPILWRTELPFFKTDHATLSPDGSKLIVSLSAADEAAVLNTKSGARIASFKTGHLPHQNDYSADGKLIFNGSLGALSLPYALDAFKGPRLLTVVDAETFQPVRTYEFPEGVRPSVMSQDGKTMYVQLSYLNGLIKFDLDSGKEVGRLTEPFSAFAQANFPTEDDYPHNSAHHGLAMTKDETKLCDAGTIDNTVSIVDTASLKVLSVINVGMVPYWATTSVDGRYCFVSLSGDNAVAVIDYATGLEVARTMVGRFPQRNRTGKIPEANLQSLAPQQ